MNPIFARRNRSSATPSNNSASSSGQQSLRGQLSPGSGPSRVSGLDVVEPLSPPKSPAVNRAAARKQSPRDHKRESEGRGHKSQERNANVGQGHARHASRASKEAEKHMILAQNFLATKQNLLAQAVLTPEENIARQNRSHSNPEKVEMSDTDSPDSEATAFRASRKEKRHSIPVNQTMDLHDIEDEEFDFGDQAQGSGSSGSRPSQCDNSYLHLSSAGTLGDVSYSVSTLDAKTWRDLKAVVLGTNGILHDGWHNQGFNFDTAVPYGLVQKRGGPCGVLAVVQALILRNLIFGSPYTDEGDDDLPFQEPIVNYSSDAQFHRQLTSKRAKALVCALTEILWRCSNVGNKGYFHFDNRPNCWSDSDNGSQDGGVAKVCLNPNTLGAEVRSFRSAHQLRNYIEANLSRMDCVNLLYSAVLSRGIQTVQEDFDFPNSPLLGTHGYCSQELVNLLAIGKAISNVFDDQISLGDKILKGIESRCDIGLLSLFEHYDSCQVGSYLKCPKYPVWIVCSESHFSVLFSLEKELSQDTNGLLTNFDLYYYDGLAHQHNHIKLSIELNGRHPQRRSFPPGSSASPFRSTNNNNNESDNDEELVPPLEKCIRTKWKNAFVDWNETEPIL